MAEAEISLNVTSEKKIAAEAEEPIDLHRVVNALLASKQATTVASFRLHMSEKGKFAMTVTAPKMDEVALGKYILESMDFMSAAILAYAETGQIVDSVQAFLDEAQTDKRDSGAAAPGSET